MPKSPTSASEVPKPLLRHQLKSQPPSLAIHLPVNGYGMSPSRESHHCHSTVFPFQSSRRVCLHLDLVPAIREHDSAFKLTGETTSKKGECKEPRALTNTSTRLYNPRVSYAQSKGKGDGGKGQGDQREREGGAVRRAGELSRIFFGINQFVFTATLKPYFRGEC